MATWEQLTVHMMRMAPQINEEMLRVKMKWEEMVKVCDEEIYNLQKLQNQVDSNKKSDDKKDIGLSAVGAISGGVVLATVFAPVSVPLIVAGAAGSTVSGVGSIVHSQSKFGWEVEVVHQIKYAVKRLEDIIKDINANTRQAKKNMADLCSQCNITVSEHDIEKFLQVLKCHLGLMQARHIRTALQSSQTVARSVGRTTAVGLKALKVAEIGVGVVCLGADLWQLCHTIDGIDDKHKLSQVIDKVIEGMEREKQRAQSELN